MIQAAWWGLLGGAALILGAVAGLKVRLSSRRIGGIIAFGSGGLISALTLELTWAAVQSAGPRAAAGGLLIGAGVFLACDWVVDRRGGEGRKCPDGIHESASGSALAIAALLDGIPESAAIGVSAVNLSGIGLSVVIAVFLSNVPEAMASTAGMVAAGHRARNIMTMWSGVTLASTAAAAAGFSLLSRVTAPTLGWVEAFTAGAILAMVVDTLLPEAVDHAGRLLGVYAAFGFALAVVTSLA